MPTFDIPGNTGNWINTGVQVQAGQWVRVTASGWISFAMGAWHRNANGLDQNGQGREHAGVHHPGPGLTRNSLIAHIGGHTLQAGVDMAFRAPASGPILLMVNDEYRPDNGGAWRVTLDPLPGPLRIVQNLLVVTQGAMAQSGAIEKDIQDFASTVHQHSQKALQVVVTRLHIPAQVHPSELVAPVKDSNQRVAGYNPTFAGQLQQAGRNPANFDGIFRLYEQPTGFNDYGYWTWGTISGLPRRIGYTTIPVNALGKEPDGGLGILLHEYLHHLDSRFDDAGVPGFYNPDTKHPASHMTNMQFYKHIMETHDPSYAAPPYGLLHRIFGQLH